MALGIEEVVNEALGLLKNIYDSGVIDQEQRLTKTYDTLSEKPWDLRGNGWTGAAHLKRSSSYKFANEKEGIPQDTHEVSKQFNIDTVEMFGDVSFTKKFLSKLATGNAGFADFTFKIEDLIKTQRKNLNQAVYIGPKMTRAVLTSSPSASTSFTVDNVQYIHIGMQCDIYNSSTLVEGNFEVVGISGLTVTVDRPVTATSGYQLYLHEEFLNAGTGKGMTSFGQITDDTTNHPATFEGIDRSVYNSWKGNRIDAASAPLTNDLLQKAANLLHTASGHDYMTESYSNYVHPDTIRRYLAIILGQKRFVDASKFDSGMEKPEMLTWNGRPLVIDVDATKNSWFMIHKEFVGKKELSPLSVESDFGGARMKWRSGYMQGVILTYFSGQIGTSKPNANLVIDNLQAVS